MNRSILPTAARLPAAAVILALALAVSPQTAVGQQSAGHQPLGPAEAQLAERYERLEILAGRLAELSGSTQPRRAALLRDLIARSRERDVAGQFDAVVDSLEKESYSAALTGQTQLHGDLVQLLDLLLQEDRDRDLDNQRKRVRRYLQDVNRLIRLERAVKARTDGGDDERQLADDQRRVGEETGKLGREIEEAEGIAAARAKRAAEQRAADAKSGKSPQQGDESENQSGSPQDGKGKPQEGSPQQGPPQSGDQQQGDQQPSNSQQGSPQEGGQQGQPGEESQQQQEEQQQSPEERATDRLRAAQQKMAEAQKKLEQAERKNATAEQQEALEQLEQAKAALERILRQLREEELERMLVLLEARFRKMLDQQVEVYDETKRLDAAADKAPPHELEIAGGRLSRQEQAIVREADRALVLMREDGTSVAFPEAIEQVREDMKSIARRLTDAKFEMLTQGLEEDVIASLEETLAALQQAIQKLREQRARQQQGGGSGEPGEQPLVDQIAELRMIRALQMRVNRRTQQYGAMIEGEQALDPEVLEALDNLSLWQQKVFRATRELDDRSREQ